MIIEIIFWLLLLDSLVALYITWFGKKEFFNKIVFFKRYFPLTRGWTSFYFVLVLFIGYIIFW